MKEEQILDQEFEKNNFTFNLDVTIKLVFALFTLVILNIFTAYYLPVSKMEVITWDASNDYTSYYRLELIMNSIWLYPLFGFLIGFITSLIPYKNLSYWNKFSRFSLVAILIFEVSNFLFIMYRYLWVYFI